MMSTTIALLLACGTNAREGFGNDPTPSAGATDPTGEGGAGTFGAQKPTPADAEASDECQRMDIVFVIDNSGSMEEEQNNLAANFSKLVTVLDAFKTKSGAGLDWRVAITTTGRDVSFQVETPVGTMPKTDTGQDNGAFRMKQECGSTRRWIERSDANATSTFSCLANVGTWGSGVEMPLLALDFALNKRMADGTNAGFLRPDALLAVIILTDEDDCSREDDHFTIKMTDTCATTPEVRPVADYAKMLDVAAHGPGRWAAAVIAGDQPCTSAFGDAAEAKRLKDFVSLAGKNGTFSSICSGDLTTGLTQALNVFDGACKTFPSVVH